ncbi:flagellar basal body rod protein FlgB [Delftia lacustris]|uniref:Flagellar basal body rod protein FlgB n=1 Tax=Delftia lacustris TaxID=558537 RepID=A0A1H3T5N0_9BURK|nr:flagellar basal body rod protein FlgB [Delftia lacustris]SDZ45188.1 flagellar basal-body rod protein FlgB [Delftia lacustris]
MSEMRFEDVALKARIQRLAVLASNIANADTPGYQAKDVDFKSALERSALEMMPLKETSASHISSEKFRTGNEFDLVYRTVDQPSLDGNTVDLDKERAVFVDNSIRTELAMRQAIDEYVEIGQLLSDMK